MPAPVYKTENQLPLQAEFNKLQDICEQLHKHTPGELHVQLEVALGDLRAAARAVVPINRAGGRVGYGIDKTQKAIACDTAIAIIRQIKALKAW